MSEIPQGVSDAREKQINEATKRALEAARLDLDSHIYTVRKGDTLGEVIKQFTSDRGKTKLKELIDINEIKEGDEDFIIPCQQLKIPAHWRLKKHANFSYREGRNWPGDESACPLPSENQTHASIPGKNDKTHLPPIAMAGIAAKAISGQGTKGGPIRRPDTPDSAGVPARPAVAPPEAPVRLSQFLQNKDIVTFVNSKGITTKGRFLEYSKSTGQPRLNMIKPTPSNPTYAIKPETITQVIRRGEILDLTTLRLNKYLKPKAIEVVSTLKLEPAEVIQLEKDFARNPKMARQVSEVLVNPKYAKYNAFVRNFKKYGTLAFVCIALYGFDKAEDKVAYSLQTGAEIGGFMAGMRLTDMAIGSKISHPLGRLVVDLLGGGIVAMGAGELWRENVTPQLDRYMPNRNQKTGLRGSIYVSAGHGLQMAGMELLGGAIGTVDYALEKTGVKGGVDADTDPLVYLGKTITMANTSNFSEGVWKKYMVRNLNEFTREATETYNELSEDLAPHKRAIKEHAARHPGNFNMNQFPELAEHFAVIADIELQLDKLKMFIKKDKKGRPLWISEKLEQLEQQKAILDFLTLQYIDFLDSEFPEGEGAKFFASLLNRLKKGGDIKLVRKNEEAIWDKLMNHPIVIEEQSITFSDFFSLYKLNHIQSGQMASIAEKGDLSGARI